PEAMTITASSAMEARRVWERTASAPCSKVSRTLSCFSSFREMCSGMYALLHDLETYIVAQLNRRPAVAGGVTLAANERSVDESPPAGHGSLGICRRVAYIVASSTC